MDSTRFDQISKLFAQRRLSRRQALQHAGAGIAAAGLAGAAMRTTVAQDATPATDASPVAGADATTAEFLFLQSFESGTIAPREAADGTFTLTLQHGLGQTIYFSDRPERIVGAAPTSQFLDGLGFTESNPPNAALVVDTADGDVDIAVVELTNPTYDEASTTATYDISVLQNYAEVDLQFQTEPADLAGLAASFGSAHLFIDDCADVLVYCHYADESAPPRSIGLQGFCWSWSMFECKFCDYDSAVQQCYSRLPDFCNDRSPVCTPIAD